MRDMEQATSQGAWETQDPQEVFPTRRDVKGWGCFHQVRKNFAAGGPKACAKVQVGYQVC